MRERQRGVRKSRSPMNSNGLGRPKKVPNATRKILPASSSSLSRSRPTLIDWCGRLIFDSIAFCGPRFEGRFISWISGRPSVSHYRAVQNAGRKPIVSGSSRAGITLPPKCAIDGNSPSRVGRWNQRNSATPLFCDRSVSAPRLFSQIDAEPASLAAWSRPIHAPPSCILTMGRFSRHGALRNPSCRLSLPSTSVPTRAG